MDILSSIIEKFPIYEDRIINMGTISAIIEKLSVHDTPFAWLVDTGWDYMTDKTDPNEYAELDRIYDILIAISSEEQQHYLNEYRNEYDKDATLESVRKEYETRFPKLIAQTLIAVGNDINKGNIKIQITD